MIVKLEQNNSGGSFWLDDEQFDALLADGWAAVEDYHLHTWGRNTQNMVLDIPAVDDPQAAVTIAKIEFERVTGQDADAIGCTCCGPPFRFEDLDPTNEWNAHDIEEAEKALMPQAEAVEITEVLMLEAGE